MKIFLKGDWKRTLMGVAITTILTVSVFFRIWKLDSIPGINGDEAWLGWKAFQVAHGARLDWMTFSGNLTDPFYILPLIVLHKLFAPSVFLLRCVAVISGLLVLPVNYYFCRWIFGGKTAWGTTLLLAVLPVNIVYSRFGWEPSQSVLFALPVLYLALALGAGLIKPLAGCMLFGISLLAALTVHPTNFFLTGFGVTALAARRLHPEGNFKKLALWFGISAAGFVLLGLIAILKAPPGVHDEIVARIGDFSWMHDGERFLLVWDRFFNGLNSLAFITGSWKEACNILDVKLIPWIGWPDRLVLGAFFFSLVALFIGISRNFCCGDPIRIGALKTRSDIILLGGFTGSSLLFDLLNGFSKCAVWFDRYALWVVPAGVLVLVRGAVRLQEIAPQCGVIIRVTGFALCLSLLFQTWSGYFSFSLKTGGNAGLEARVGTEDLKLAAARELAALANTQGIHSPILVSSDWFVYWPILYTLRSQPKWKKWDSVREDLYPHYSDQRGWDIFTAVQEQRVVFAEFEGSQAWDVWNPLIRDSGIQYRSLKFDDIAGRPVLLVKIPMPKDSIPVPGN